MAQDKTVLLKVFSDSFSAQLTKALLESHEIPSIIMNENFTQFSPIFKKSVGGVQLFVFAEDLEKANEVISAEIDDAQNEQE